MKRVCVFVVVMGCFVSAAWAQQTIAKGSTKDTKPVYYDTFKEKWLDPTKWLAVGPWGTGTLEIVREIQNGRLRLEARNVGAGDSDSGDQWSQSGLYFVDPNSVQSITADVVVRSFSGLGCSTNADYPNTDTEVRIGGTFFNTGTGDAADDVWGYLILWIDTTNPESMSVGNWNSKTEWTEVDSYPVKTPLTLTFAWDKANHQFVATVEVKGEPGSRKVVTAPYSVSDAAQPVSPMKSLDAGVETSNCTSAKTFGQVEAFYDNVRINQSAP